MNYPTIPECWLEVLKPAFDSDSYRNLKSFLDERYTNNANIYPKKHNIFRALKSVKFNDVKVVILGQDPFHDPGQANGLAFAVNSKYPAPPTLRNIFIELKNDLEIDLPQRQASLEGWAKQGVLLLNSCLTVEDGKPGSHANKGWEVLTDFIIKSLSDKIDNLVFILWGGYAQKKVNLINRKKHMILQSVHPSPLSAYKGFFGSKPFSQTNDCLRDKFNKSMIDWACIDVFKSIDPLHDLLYGEDWTLKDKIDDLLL